MTPRSVLASAILSLLALWPGAASPQSASLGCRIESVAGTSRHVLRCRQGVTIIVESGARYSLLDRNGDGVADGVMLRRKALLLEASRNSGETGFVVVTPQAIAAVRGTRWTVDVQGGSTSVFVLDGRVAVRRPAATAGVSLGRGEGVDVPRGTGRLVVKRWPQPRVSALLARFGQ